MESSGLFIIPKRKTRSSNISSRSVETSPREKKWKQSYSPASVFSKLSGDDKIMAAMNLTEGVTKK